MEELSKIKEFLSVNGDGSGYGYGDGSGYGYGDGSGYGYGDGSGYGYGDGDGSGYGYGDGDGLKSINGELIWRVDDVPTLIDKVKGSVAKGRIVRGDLSLEPCWIVKGGNSFAHGKTLHEARDALFEKLFEDMPEEERIEEFVKAHKPNTIYPDKDFFDWHHRLTGSCEMGRMEFARSHGLEALDGSRTVEEFIALCENSYGGAVIKKLKEYYNVSS